MSPLAGLLGVTTTVAFASLGLSAERMLVILAMVGVVGTALPVVVLIRRQCHDGSSLKS